MDQGSRVMPSRAHERGVKAYQEGKKSMWRVCISARRIVGRYEKGATINFAHDLAVSSSQVENYALAADTRLFLRRYGMRQDDYDNLSHSHFSAMGRLIRKHEFDPWVAIQYIQDANQLRLGYKAMENYVNDMNGRGKGWSDWWRDITGLAENLVVAGDAPEFVYRVSRLILAWERRNATRIYSDRVGYTRRK